MSQVIKYRYNLKTYPCGHNDMSRWFTAKSIEISPDTNKPAIRNYTIYHPEGVAGEGVTFDSIYEILKRITDEGFKQLGVTPLFDIEVTNV